MTHLGLQIKGVGLGAALFLALGALSTPSMAGDAAAGAKPAAAGTKPAAAAAAPATGDKKKQSAWVKLCESAPMAQKGEDGKPAQVTKKICLTHHERLDGNTGMVLVSAAIREIEGSDKRSLMVMVPLGMALPPGIRAAVYSPEQWAKAAKNEKVDEKGLKPVTLKYSLCHAAGCTAEVVVTAEVIESMKGGGGIMVLAMNAQAKPIGFPVPLTGFSEAFSGKPVDNKKYAEARGRLMAQIRGRQMAAQKALREVQGAKPGEAGGPPAVAAPAAGAPAKKKKQ